jgi:hypothetical protein
MISTSVSRDRPFEGEALAQLVDELRGAKPLRPAERCLCDSLHRRRRRHAAERLGVAGVFLSHSRDDVDVGARAGGELLGPRDHLLSEFR